MVLGLVQFAIGEKGNTQLRRGNVRTEPRDSIKEGGETGRGRYARIT